jgi:hypothetical protein
LFSRKRKKNRQRLSLRRIRAPRRRRTSSRTTPDIDSSDGFHIKIPEKSGHRLVIA